VWSAKLRARSEFTQATRGKDAINSEGRLEGLMANKDIGLGCT
jgi:hypothetical protein